LIIKVVIVISSLSFNFTSSKIYICYRCYLRNGNEQNELLAWKNDVQYLYICLNYRIIFTRYLGLGSHLFFIDSHLRERDRNIWLSEDFSSFQVLIFFSQGWEIHSTWQQNTIFCLVFYIYKPFELHYFIIIINKF
jgi:hypothetical protein